MRSRSTPPPDADPLRRGEFVRICYRLGRSRATGVLTVYTSRGSETLVLRRGNVVTAASDPTGRALSQKLAQLAASDNARFRFDGGIAAYPPGLAGRQVSLAGWARSHLESQVDSTRAATMVRELAGTRLIVRRDVAPDSSICDATDRRILEVLSQPRRLDQIWTLARTPRFRLLTFIHFLRCIGALRLIGVAAPIPDPPTVECAAAHRILGVSASADRTTVKRAYRRLARALHPDLQPSLSPEKRRALERKLARVNSAYRELLS